MSSVLLNGIGNGGLTSLRKTRSSEVSTFVKNYNKAQSRFMRKEVDIWYKNTRHTLRSVSGNQQKLYSSLLKLSKEKKAIKIRREDEAMHEKISRENYLRRKEQLCRRKQLAKQDTIASATVNILILDRRGHQNAFKMEVNAGEASNATAIVHDPIAEEEEGSTKSSCNNENLPNERKLVLDVMKMSQNSESVEKEINFTNSRNDKADVQDGVPTKKRPSENLPGQVFRGKLSSSLLTKPILTPHSGQGDCTSFSNLEPLKHLDDEALFLHMDSAKGLSKKGIDRDVTVRSEYHSIPGENSTEVEKESKNVIHRNKLEQNHAKAVKTNKRKRDPQSFKKRQDPTEKLNSNSSIQVMQGKTYKVSSYRRDSRGSLREECKTMDTTIDVSQYFNFNYYRDRHVRRRMLENSKSVERKQSRRVNEFLMKLDQDQESVRILAEMKAQKMEEERLEIKKREENIMNKPPRYGLQKEYTVTPGYVRKYKRRSGSRRISRDKRKSSWHLPSLYTLNLKTSNFPSTQTNRRNDRRTDTLEIDLACTGHLVNINLEKYTKHASHGLKQSASFLPNP